VAERPTLDIALALVWRDGRLLVTRRPEGVHLAGYWEFPGGKIKAGESAEHAAEREVVEEVGIRCRARERRPSLSYDYPERSVVLHPVDCDWLEGEARLMGVSAARWVTPVELGEYAFPPANAALVELLTVGQR
jgi:8-oxo-dGTP diphosphatase